MLSGTLVSCVRVKSWVLVRCSICLCFLVFISLSAALLVVIRLLMFCVAMSA